MPIIEPVIKKSIEIISYSEGDSKEKLMMLEFLSMIKVEDKDKQSFQEIRPERIKEICREFIKPDLYDSDTFSLESLKTEEDLQSVKNHHRAKFIEFDHSSDDKKEIKKILEKSFEIRAKANSIIKSLTTNQTPSANPKPLEINPKKQPTKKVLQQK